MPNDVDTVEIQPGSDSNAHVQATQQKVAEAVSAISGTPVTPAQVAPPALQQPEIPGALPEDPKLEIDFLEHINAEMGKSPVLTEPNRGPLSIFRKMLGKKNPGKVIQPERK